MTIVKRSTAEFVNRPELYQTFTHPFTNEQSTSDTAKITSSTSPFAPFLSIAIPFVTIDSPDTIFDIFDTSFCIKLEFYHSSDEESKVYPKSTTISGKIDVGKCSILTIALDIVIFIENGSEEQEVTSELLEPHHPDPEVEGTSQLSEPHHSDPEVKGIFSNNTAISLDAVPITFI